MRDLASQLTYLTYELSHNQAIQEALRTELLLSISS